MSDTNNKVNDLLVELGTEELPPTALSKLSSNFTSGIVGGLKKAGFELGLYQSFATPRRLAVLIKDVNAQQADKTNTRRGPAVEAAFDGEGNPTPAANGFARSCGVEVGDLERLETDKGIWLVFEQIQKGKNISEVLAQVVSESLAKLPIPKRMRWGDRSEEFVRPVHWLVMMHGERVIEGEVLGLVAGDQTYGHRFHHPEAITLTRPSEYESKLTNPGRVIVDFESRKQTISEQVEQLEIEIKGKAIVDPDLLNEVTGLVEWPVALMGDFDDRYLDVPDEALISSMEKHQKYFPIKGLDGKLLAKFITVANIQSKQPSQIKEGNERVIRPRLADAEFFWNKDLDKGLEVLGKGLSTMTFQNKLGSLADKSQRVASLAVNISSLVNGNEAYALRAAQLAKCDLLSDMVGEFADLQGVMGRYYAIKAGEAHEVAQAIQEQYLPRYAGDSLPSCTTGLALALADRLDTLVGIFAIGQKPTGAKDPYALRRASLGVLRMLIELGHDIDIKALLTATAEQLQDKVDSKAVIDDVFDYLMERLRVYYVDNGVDVDVYESVVARKPTNPLDFDQRVKAIQIFKRTDAGQILGAANKRISNILRKSGFSNETCAVNETLFADDSETALWSLLTGIRGAVDKDFAERCYEAGLEKLAVLKDPVDLFFDNVMVMADDEAVKNNRLALLGELRALFLGVGDLSRLQG